MDSQPTTANSPELSKENDGDFIGLLFVVQMLFLVLYVITSAIGLSATSKVLRLTGMFFLFLMALAIIYEDIIPDKYK